MEERGFDTTVTAAAVHDLLRDAIELVPGVREFVIDELVAGIRPGSPDNTPLVGPGAVDGLLWATGHHRHGILLAPVTAEIVAELLAPSRAGRTGALGAELIRALDPGRFAPGRHDGDRGATGRQRVGVG
jgi:glycine oxidase